MAGLKMEVAEITDIVPDPAEQNQPQQDIFASQSSTASKSRRTSSSWGKSLEHMPVFTMHEIESHRQKSGKSSDPIKKTLKRGTKFKQERYLSADYIYVRVKADQFHVKGKCRASMSKKEIHNVNVSLFTSNSQVKTAYCTCKAGKSQYCNHVMALLLELADYSLNQLSKVPEEQVCTSQARKWGIPGNKNLLKEPIMGTHIQKDVTSRGIKPTLYNPRPTSHRSLDMKKISDLQAKLAALNPLIGYAHIIPHACSIQMTDTRFGKQAIGSPLSFQLAAVDFNFGIHHNLSAIPDSMSTCTETAISLPSLPLECMEHKDLTTNNASLSEKEQQFLCKIMVSKEESTEIEKKTVQQRKCPEWIKHRENRIGSSVAHRIVSRKRNFDVLAKQLSKPNKELNDLSETVRQKLAHGVKFESVAREKYHDVMKFHLNRKIALRETGMVIPHHTFWLEASPDGLVFDAQSSIKHGLLEIKCPEGKKNQTPNEAMADNSFYIEEMDGKPLLKKVHPLGYYTQIQVAMGFCEAKWCDLVVYFYKGIIIVRVPFDQTYYEEVHQQLSNFYFKWYLPQLLNSPQPSD